MPSLQISVTPNKRAAARFVNAVRRAIQRALLEEQGKRGIKQTDLARAIGVHRSVINRELKGHKDITLGRVAELAWALGRKPTFELEEPLNQVGSNQHSPTVPAAKVSSSAATMVVSPNAIRASAGASL